MKPHRHLLLALALLFPLIDQARPAGAPVELYQAKPIVTGTGEANRKIGFTLAFKDVLVKVSGDPRLLDDPRVAALAADASPYVAEFRYRDRMEGIPIHDEQGSHDRPHDLTTLFAPEEIDAVLASLGSRPWPGSRPTVTVFLAVANGDRTFVLSSDGEHGVDMRESLAAASAKVAIPATLPTSAALQSADLTQKTLPDADDATLEKLAAAAGGEYALVGSLAWSDQERGWIADWKITAGRKTHTWQIRGVSFDDAFRNAIRGAAQVLSGNGNPN